MPKSMIEGILTKDYMNLILVVNGLKPATEMGFVKCYGHKCGTPRPISIADERKEYAPQKQKRLLEYKDTINKFPLIYTTEFSEGLYDCDRLGCNDVFFNECVQVYIAKDRLSLDRLLNAKTHREKGEAYGFPKEAIDAFANPGRKGFGFASEMYMNIEQAIDADVPIPSWLAYLSYVPEKTDFVNNDVSESSRILGEKYQSFMRQNHPDIALKVEEDFIVQFPKRTYVDEKGAIVLEFAFDGPKSH
jgi:hypothetical protein